MKKYVIMAIIIIVIGAVIFISRGRQAEVQRKPFVRLVSSAVIDKGDVILKKQFFGTVKGKQQTEIYPDVPGKFIKYNVQEGQYVNKDQIIAEVDRSIPGMTYETAKIKAPISGVIYDLTFVKGQPVLPQMPVANISDPSMLTARIDVSKDILNEIQQCIDAEVYINNEKYNAKVIRRSYLPNNMTGLGSVDVKIENGSKMLINSAAKVNLFTGEADNVLRVPYEAYHTDDAGAYIYLIEDGKAVKTSVEIGLIGNEYVEVANSISEGDTVITVGSSFVRDGQQVRIK